MEELMSLSQVASFLPRKNGKKIHTSSIWRWITVGVRGVRLHSLRLGAKYFVTSEAIEDFGKKLAALGPQKRTIRRKCSEEDRRSVFQKEIESIGLSNEE